MYSGAVNYARQPADGLATNESWKQTVNHFRGGQWRWGKESIGYTFLKQIKNRKDETTIIIRTKEKPKGITSFPFPCEESTISFI